MNAGLSAREVAVKAALDVVRERCDVASRREADPVGVVHGYRERDDRELVALVAACVAFGNAKAIVSKLGDLLQRLGPEPARATDDRRRLFARLRGWKHRVFRGEDIARLLLGARAVQRAYGSLGACFEAELRRAQAERDRKGGTESSPAPLREALASWCDAIRRAGKLGASGASGRRGPAHLLPNVRGPSGSKRLLLFLRWMVRPADGVDLGMWNVDPSQLLVPVDVHIHKLSYNLGLTRRRRVSWRTTEEITRALSRFDSADPAGYDFSLCHMGMLQRCPSRRDPRRCQGCPVMRVCIHWQARHKRL
jgi:uncharacterized protein (TIGR02757 family)